MASIPHESSFRNRRSLGCGPCIAPRLVARRCFNGAPACKPQFAVCICCEYILGVRQLHGYVDAPDAAASRLGKFDRLCNRSLHSRGETPDRLSQIVLLHGRQQITRWRYGR